MPLILGIRTSRTRHPRPVSLHTFKNSSAEAYVSAQMYGFDRQMEFTLGHPRLRPRLGPFKAGVEWRL